MKMCRDCGETKGLGDFHRKSSSKDGFMSSCKECRKVYQKKWIDENREYVNTRNLARYHSLGEAGKERHNARGRSWAEANKEKHRQSVKNHRLAKPEMHREKEHRRRARARGNGVFAVLPSEVARLLASPCAACGSRESIVIDHVVPIARGGRHSVGNLQPLCLTCNASKGSSFMSEFRNRDSMRRAA